MAKKLQVVFASAEAAPFVKTGGLGDVAGSLPKALKRAGADVIVMVPKYSTIPDVFREKMEHVADFYVSLGWRNEYCGLERLDVDGVTYLFIDNEHYFARSYPYGFFDDGERFAFFSKAVTESLQHLPEGFTCDVLHCNDWHTALAPVFLREFYQGLPLYERVKTVFSIHNIAFQGQFSDTVLNDVLGLAHIPNAARQLRCDANSVNYMLGALNYTDRITTVSPTYAAEIQTPEYGEHLDGVLRRRNNILRGILNGIDTVDWDPATDYQLTENYHVGDMEGKAACKAALQQELGLEVRADRPLMVMVTRLTRQKGMDLVTYSLDRILSGGVQVAVLGTGDYEESMRYFSNKYPGSMAARITFDSALSRRMYSGADMFLMPSLFEPCGLSQIIAMRYGTLPIVRETGGLRDTVIPYNQFTGEGTGFSFTHFNGDEMGDAVFRAARLFWDNRDAWNKVVEQAMTKDFSWTRSADEYIKLYLELAGDTEVMPEPVSTPEPAPESEPEVVPAPEPEPVQEPAEEPQAAEAADVEADVKPVEAEEKPAEVEAPAAEKAAEPEPEKEAPATKPAAKTTTAKKTATKTTAAKATTTKAKAATTKTKTTTAKATATKTTATKTASKTAAKATTTKAATTKTATKAAEKPATATKSSASKTTATKAASTTATKTTAAKATTTKAAPKTATKAASTTATKTTAAKATTTKAAPKTAAKSTTTKAATASKAKATTAKTVEAPTEEAKPATTATKTTAATKTTKASVSAAKKAASRGRK